MCIKPYQLNKRVMYLIATGRRRTIDQYKRICCYTDWEEKRPYGAPLSIDHLDLSLCTHVVFVFAVMKEHPWSPFTEKSVENKKWADKM